MAYAIVGTQTPFGVAAPGSSKAVAFASNVTAGNTIVVGVSWASETITISSVTDTLGNTYTIHASSLLTVTGQSQRIQFATATNIAGGANTVTVTLSSSSSLGVQLWEVSGGATVSPLDVVGANTGNGTALSANITPTQVDDAIFAIVYGQAGSETAGSNYTIRNHLNEFYYTASMDRLDVATSGSPVAVDATQPSIAQWAVSAIALKVASGGGGVKTVSLTLRDLSQALLPNLSGIHVAIWKTTDIATIAGAPDYTSTTGSTNSSGVMNINVNSVAAFSVGDTVAVALSNQLGNKTLLLFSTVVSA